MSEGKKDRQALSHVSNKELAERALTPTDDWITVPEGMTIDEHFDQLIKEVVEEGRKRKKQDNG